MVHIYYHIYAINGVESIIDEQLSLIKKHFDFPYILNVGISIAKENESTTHILERFENVRDIRAMGNEFVTLDLIEKDKEKFGDSDYILYLHTKGASRMEQDNYYIVESWRRVMDYFNIEKVKNVFKLFEKTNYNTYGILMVEQKNGQFYGGNFWWMTSDYAKTIDITGVSKSNRYNAEVNYLIKGKNWKPYIAFQRGSGLGYDFYSKEFETKDYRK
jgi:hypothetical protein